MSFYHCNTFQTVANLEKNILISEVFTWSQSWNYSQIADFSQYSAKFTQSRLTSSWKKWSDDVMCHGFVDTLWWFLNQNVNYKCQNFSPYVLLWLALTNLDSALQFDSGNYRKLILRIVGVSVLLDCSVLNYLLKRGNFNHVRCYPHFWNVLKTSLWF